MTSNGTWPDNTENHRPAPASPAHWPVVPGGADLNPDLASDKPQNDWAGRRLAVGFALAMVAGMAAYLTIRPIYQAQAQIRVDGVAASDPRLLSLIAADVVSPAVLGKVGLADTGTAAKVVARVGPDKASVLLETTGRPREAIIGRLDALFEAYRDRLSNSAAGQGHLLTQRDQVAASLDAARDELKATLADLADRPAEKNATQILDQFGQLGQRWRTLQSEQRDAQRELDGLRHALPPVARIDEGELADVEARDAMLTQDRAQAHVVQRQLGDELLAAMGRVDATVEAMAAAIDSAQRRVRGERDSRGDGELASAIGQTEPHLDRLADALRLFSDQWVGCRDRVRGANDAANVDELLRLHREVEQIVTDLGDTAEPALTQLLGVVDALGQINISLTQRSVAQAAIGRIVRSLDAAYAVTARQAAQATPSGNFRLGAYRDSLVGLTQRLARRRAMMRQQLQDQADRRARQQRQDRIDWLVERIDQADRQMDECVETLVSQHGDLRATLAALSSAPGAKLAEASRSKVAALRAELHEVDRQLADAGVTAPVRAEALLYQPAMVVGAPVNGLSRLVMAAMVFAAFALALVAASVSDRRSMDSLKS